MFSHKTVLALLAGLALGSMTPAAFGQRFEVGGGGGASFYNKNTVSGGRAEVDAGFKPGYGFNAFLGQLGNRLGGELRYSFASNEMELKSGGQSFSMTGRTQALHYDLLVYFNDKKAKVRPYVLAGGGVKQYTGSGGTNVMQPFISTVVLTNTSEWKMMATAGGGIRVALSPKVHLRAEVLSYMTQAPTKVITPVTGNLGGWYFDIMPTVNLSYVW